MLTKLWCWLFGHKVVVKAFTGETMVSDNGLGHPITRALYVLERKDFCVRCGKRISIRTSDPSLDAPETEDESAKRAGTGY